MSKLNDKYMEILSSTFLPLYMFENIQDKKFFLCCEVKGFLDLGV